MKCQNCGKESPAKFCSKVCWEEDKGKKYTQGKKTKKKRPSIKEKVKAAEKKDTHVTTPQPLRPGHNWTYHGSEDKPRVGDVVTAALDIYSFERGEEYVIAELVETPSMRHLLLIEGHICRPYPKFFKLVKRKA